MSDNCEQIDWGKIKKIALLPVDENKTGKGIVTILKEEFEWSEEGEWETKGDRSPIFINPKDAKKEGQIIEFTIKSNEQKRKHH